MAPFLEAFVRPLVTLGLVGATIYLAFDGVLSPEAVKDLAITAVAFWFGTRSAERGAEIATGTPGPPSSSSSDAPAALPREPEGRHE